MKKGTALLAILFALLIIYVLVLTIMAFNKRTPTNPLRVARTSTPSQPLYNAANTTTPNPTKQESGYVGNQGQIEHAGYFLTSLSGDNFFVIAKILSVYEHQGKIYATLSLSNHTQIEKPFLLMSQRDGLMHFALTTQHTNGIFPYAGDTTAQPPYDALVATLRPFVGKEAVFTFFNQYDVQKLPPSRRSSLQALIACNQRFLALLKTGAPQTLACTPFTGQLNIYEMQ